MESKTQYGPLESEIVDNVNGTYFGIKSHELLPSDPGLIQPSIDQISEE